MANVNIFKYVTFIARLGKDLPKTSYTYKCEEIISVSKVLEDETNLEDHEKELLTTFEIETKNNTLNFYFDSKNACTRTHNKILEVLYGTVKK